MKKEEIIKDGLQKLLEAHFELKDLKDWDWRLRQVEVFILKTLSKQKRKIKKMIEGKKLGEDESEDYRYNIAVIFSNQVLDEILKELNKL